MAEIIVSNKRSGKKNTFDYKKGREAVAKIAKNVYWRASETKHTQLTTTVAGTAIAQASTNPLANLIPIIVAGQAGNQRIGNKVALKEIVLRGSVNWSNTASLGCVRVVIFTDSDTPLVAANTGAQWGEVFPVVSAGNEFIAGQSSATTERFKILRDFFVRPKSPTTMAVAGQGQQEFVKKISWKKGFIQKYVNNNGNTVTNRSIYYLVVTDLAANYPTLRLEGHIKFKDL